MKISKKQSHITYLTAILKIYLSGFSNDEIYLFRQQIMVFCNIIWQNKQSASFSDSFFSIGVHNPAGCQLVHHMSLATDQLWNPAKY